MSLDWQKGSDTILRGKTYNPLKSDWELYPNIRHQLNLILWLDIQVYVKLFSVLV